MFKTTFLGYEIRFVLRDLSLLLYPYKLITTVLLITNIKYNYSIEYTDSSFLVNSLPTAYSISGNCFKSYINNCPDWCLNDDFYVADALPFPTVLPLILLVISGVFFAVISIIRFCFVKNRDEFIPIKSWKLKYKSDHYMFIFYSTPVLSVNILLLIPFYGAIYELIFPDNESCSYYLHFEAVSSDYYNYIMLCVSVILWVIGLFDVFISLMKFQYDWIKGVDTRMADLNVTNDNNTSNDLNNNHLRIDLMTDSDVKLLFYRMRDLKLLE
jgi:hypothetical protein